MQIPEHQRVAQEARRRTMLAELHGLEAGLTLPSLSEAIRLLESEKFQQLTTEHIREVAEYRSIEIDDERFFHRAFTRGKEVAASLGYALYIGRETVREDLIRLRATLLGQAASEGSVATAVQ